MSRKPSHNRARIAALEAELARYKDGVAVANHDAFIVGGVELAQLRADADFAREVREGAERRKALVASEDERLMLRGEFEVTLAQAMASPFSQTLALQDIDDEMRARGAEPGWTLNGGSVERHKNPLNLTEYFTAVTSSRWTIGDMLCGLAFALGMALGRIEKLEETWIAYDAFAEGKNAELIERLFEALKIPKATAATTAGPALAAALRAESILGRYLGDIAGETAAIDGTSGALRAHAINGLGETYGRDGVNSYMRLAYGVDAGEMLLGGRGMRAEITRAELEERYRGHPPADVVHELARLDGGISELEADLSRRGVLLADRPPESARIQARIDFPGDPAAQTYPLRPWEERIREGMREERMRQAEARAQRNERRLRQVEERQRNPESIRETLERAWNAADHRPAGSIRMRTNPAGGEPLAYCHHDLGPGGEASFMMIRHPDGWTCPSCGATAPAQVEPRTDENP